MVELKTLKDFYVTGMNEMEYSDDTIANKEELREEAIKWICELTKKSIEHFSDINRWKKPGQDYSGFEFEGVWWDDWEEATDTDGAVKILTKFFNITDEEIRGYAEKQTLN